MKNFKRWILPLTCLFLIEAIKFFPGVIEKYYAQGIYPSIGKFLRLVLGNLPFSVGDCLVATLIIWILGRLLHFLVKKQPDKWKKLNFGSGMGTLLRVTIWFYIGFHLFWGLNYYRLGSAYLLKIDLEPYSTEEVDTLMQHIQFRLETACRDSLAVENGKTSDRVELAGEAKRAYDASSRKFPFLHYEHLSLKPILLGKLQAYAGYAGYIFPFTGEAQADFYVPNFTLPFTVCHEMAHQLGFGAESEANLVGFLAARESNNPAFVYSAYAGVHHYALFELYKMDSSKARPYIDRMPAILKKDMEEQYKFQEAHASFLQPALDAAYTLYLQGNNQPQGLQSYNWVVAWLIAYGKKYGWDKI